VTAEQDAPPAAPAANPWAAPSAHPTAPPVPMSPWSGHEPAGAPSWYGDWGPPRPAAPSTNAWSVVALVTGLLALVPVAVVAGVVGVVQTSRRRQAGRGLAIGGLVAAGVWTVVLALVAVGVMLLTTSDWDLQAPRGASSTWTPAGCAEAHDGEVYLVEQLRTDGWPGEDEVAGLADDACFGAFDAYVGRSYDDSAYDYVTFGPDEQEWSAGEHRVVCVIVPFEDDVLHGPVRNSGE
jgi:hypothetical protein